ncbi:unnamed protein product [Pylaiella littoralis]
MNLLLYALLPSVLLCFTASQAFVPSSKPLPSSLYRTRVQSAPASATPAGRWSKGAVAKEAASASTSTSGLSMLFGRGRQAPPQLTEEELASMSKSREEANQKVEDFLERKRADKAERKAAQQAEQREKVASRIKAEKEDAEQKKTYIPQRLEEIEKEEAMLQDRMSAFNSKIKDKEIKELQIDPPVRP